MKLSTIIVFFGNLIKIYVLFADNSTLTRAIFFSWRKMIQFDLHHIFLNIFFNEPNSWHGPDITFPLSMLHQEAVQTPRSRCGVLVLAMLLLVAISIGHHRGGVPQLKEKSPYKTATHLEDCSL